MNEEQLKKYHELVKKHDILNKRYTELENLEKNLRDSQSMSDEIRLQNLTRLAQEYEKIAKLMQEVAQQAKELNEKLA